MGQEAEERQHHDEQLVEANFRSAIFAADLHRGLKYYTAIWPSEDVSDEEIESEEFEWIEPQSEEDVRALMEELERTMGS